MDNDIETRCRVCGTDLGAGYLCDDCDDIVIERQHNPTDPVDALTFYFGAASGSTRKALRELQEPNVMLNYATKLNQPWYGIDRLFVDSGGYSFMMGKGEYETTDDEYLAFIEAHDPDLFALRDYPCEPDVLNAHERSVAEHQRMTTERHRSLLSKLRDYDIDGQPVAVVQGWTVEDYRRHVRAMRRAGVLTEYVAIGSVCRRNQEATVREIVLAVRDVLPASFRLHAFGVKAPVLAYPDVRDALSSADSQSFEMRAQWSTLEDIGAGKKEWQDTALEYLQQRRRIRSVCSSAADTGPMQQTLPTAAAGYPGGDTDG